MPVKQRTNYSLSASYFFVHYFLLVFLLSGCHQSLPQWKKGASPPSHQPWTELLQEHVDPAGWVSYEGFILDKKRLENYLDTLSNQPPDLETWPKSEQLAYWINAYNAFTIKLIVDNYPVKSITDLHPTPYIPMTNTVWHQKFFKIGGKGMSLDQIEHEILRKKFEEPRIHFAINCASYSCPPLRNEAYTADQIDQQLEAQAIGFINDPKRNRITSEKAELSAIFNWFERDFTKKKSLTDFINQYSQVKIGAKTEIFFLDYDWRLNKQGAVSGE